MIKINVLTTNKGWRRYIKNPNSFIKNFIQKILHKYIKTKKATNK